MFEERGEECGATRHLGELRGDAIGQLFALLQGPACLPGALRVAPYQLIGVEVRGIAGQVMQGQLAVESRNVFLDRERLVGGQPIKDQMQRGTTPTQHPAQQVHEQRAGQGARIGGEPEGAPLAPRLVRPWRASNAPIEARLNRTPNRWAISSRSIWRVHNPKSTPYCRGFFPLTQRNTCRSCRAVRVHGGLSRGGPRALHGHAHALP